MDRSQVTLKTSILILTVLVSAVYVLRTSNLKSSSDLHSRMLDSTQDVLDSCSGVDISDSFTQTQMDRSNDINTYLQTIRGGNELLDFATSGQSAEDFGKHYLLNLIPFIAVGVIMFVLSILCLCCTCCDYACFKGCSQATVGNKICYMTLSVLLTMLMIGTAAAGWYFTEGLDSGYQRSSCSIANTIAEFSTGSPDQNWVGLDNAISNLTIIKGLITTTVNGLPEPQQVLQNLNTPYANYNNSIAAYVTNNTNLKVADPITQAVTITPDFIAQLGSPSTKTTLSGALQYEADTKYQEVASNLNSATSSINSVKQQVSSVQQTLTTGISQIASLNGTITDILNGFSSGTQEGKTINGGLSIGIYVFFIAAAVFSGILLLGVINSFTIKSHIGFKVLVVTRYIVNVVLILCSFVSIVIFPVLIVAMEGCDAAQTALKNETIFQGYINASNLDDPDFETYAHTCFFDTGYIVGDLDLNITQSIDELQDIENQVQNLSDLANLSIPDSFVIPLQELYINLFYNGELPVTTAVGTDLLQLDALTNNSATTSTSTCLSHDIWVLNSTNCTSAYGTLFDYADGAQDNFGNPTCIGFDLYNDYTGAARYTNANPGCSNNTFILPRVTGFQNHLTSVRNVFSQVQTSLGVVNDSNTQYMNQIRTSVSLNGTSDNVQAIINQFGNNQTGLISNLNCTFIKTNSEDSIDNLCITYLPILFVTSICVLAFALVALLGLLPIFFAGKIQISDKKRVYEEGENNFDEQFLMRPQASP